MRRLPLLLVALALGLTALAAPAGARADRTLKTDDAVVVPPTGTATVLLAPTAGCRTLLASGEGDCGIVESGPNRLLFTIEPGPTSDDVLVSRPWTVKVYRPDPAVTDGWAVALATTAQGVEPGPVFANVTGTVADVTGDDADDLVLGYRSEGTGHFLDIDVVTAGDDGTPSVIAHDYIDHGVVLVKPGRLVVFAPEYKATDGNCCPTWIRRSVVREVDGKLVEHLGPRRPTEDVEVPEGDVG